MNPPPLLAIAVVASLSAFYLLLLWIAIQRAQKLRPIVDVPPRPIPDGPLQVIDRHDKVALTVAMEGPFRLALFKLGPLKLRLLAMRFGLTDGHPLSRADVAWVLHRSEAEIGVIESEALRRLGPEGRAKLETLSVPPKPPGGPDSGGYQTSGRPLPVKPIPPSLSAAVEVELPGPGE